MKWEFMPVPLFFRAFQSMLGENLLGRGKDGSGKGAPAAFRLKKDFAFAAETL